MIDPKRFVDLVTRGIHGVDPQRAVEYFEMDGKRLAEVSLSVPAAERQFIWGNIWREVINADYSRSDATQQENVKP